MTMLSGLELLQERDLYPTNSCSVVSCFSGVSSWGLQASSLQTLGHSVSLPPFQGALLRWTPKDQKTGCMEGGE